MTTKAENVLLPLIAYGTYIDNRNDIPKILDRVKTAITLGYTHIDTAHNYGTEKYVLQAINGIDRNTIFITSKIQHIINIETLRTQLGEAQYYDLLLLHYPPLNTRSRSNFKSKLLPIWRAMDEYVRSGVAKFIGISNFYNNHLDILLDLCQDHNLIYPIVNQLEIHPGNLELQYVPYMLSKNILPFAHTPLGGLGSRSLLTNEILTTIGSRIGATEAQVVLAYLLKRGIGVVTSSSNVNHMEESIQASHFINYLSPEDMDLIDSTEIGFGPLTEGSAYAWEDNTHLMR